MQFSHAARPTRLRFGLLAAVLAVASLLAATAQIASASPSRAAAGLKPTIVLEHGAWADSGSWNGVVQRLQHDGYKVYAPPDPLQGLAYDTATLKDFLGTIPGSIVLVGHSYGGWSSPTRLRATRTSRLSCTTTRSSRPRAIRPGA